MIEPTALPLPGVVVDRNGNAMLVARGNEDARVRYEGGQRVYSQAALDAAVAAERDCRTCSNWTPHHRSDVMHCSAALRCVAGGSYQRQGVAQLWEAAPVDAGF